jgi:Tfp pilus assembly protein PilN
MRAVNLIPVEQRGGSARGAGRSGGGAYAVLGLLAGLAILALMYGMAHHHVSSTKSKLTALEGRVQQAQAQASSLAPYTSFVALREQRVHAVAQLVDSRFDWAHAVHELGRVLPTSVSVSSLTGTVGSAHGAGTTSTSSSSASSTGAAPVASATPPGSLPTVTLAGCAKNQSTVALALDRLRLIDGVSSVTLQSSTKASGGSGASTGGGTGGCPNGDPSFTAQLAFYPLPAQSTPSPALSAPASSTSGTGAVKPATSRGGN